jgi:hypothetical protein
MIEVGLGWLNHPMALGSDSTTHISPKKKKKKGHVKDLAF